MATKLSVLITNCIKETNPTPPESEMEFILGCIESIPKADIALRKQMEQKMENFSQKKISENEMLNCLLLIEFISQKSVLFRTQVTELSFLSLLQIIGKMKKKYTKITSSEKDENAEKNEKSEKSEKFERSQKSERSEKSQKSEKSEKFLKIGKIGKLGKEKTQKTQKTYKVEQKVRELITLWGTYYENEMTEYSTLYKKYVSQKIINPVFQPTICLPSQLIELLPYVQHQLRNISKYLECEIGDIETIFKHSVRIHLRFKHQIEITQQQSENYDKKRLNECIQIEERLKNSIKIIENIIEKRKENETTENGEKVEIAKPRINGRQIYQMQKMKMKRCQSPNILTPQNNQNISNNQNIPNSQNNQNSQKENGKEQNVQKGEVKTQNPQPVRQKKQMNLFEQICYSQSFQNQAQQKQQTTQNSQNNPNQCKVQKENSSDKLQQQQFQRPQQMRRNNSFNGKITQQNSRNLPSPRTKTNTTPLKVVIQSDTSNQRPSSGKSKNEISLTITSSTGDNSNSSNNLNSNLNQMKPRRMQYKRSESLNNIPKDIQNENNNISIDIPEDKLKEMKMVKKSDDI